jgi:YHS domain-containing protein
MYRFLLILALLIILYFLVKRVIREFKMRHLDDRRVPLDGDQMVQDPVCRTFVPRKIAVVERVGGQTYCFCSRQCASEFARRQSA